MANKRYYWLKLKEDFFRQKEIKKLRRIAGGDTFTIIYLKMLLRSLKNDGRLYYDGIESNFISELALDIDEDESNVSMTVSYLLSNGILVQNNIEEYEILTAKEMTGSECDSAQRVRKLRLQKSLSEDKNPLQNNALQLHCNSDVTNSNTEIEIEKREKSKEKDNICADALKLTPVDHDYWKFAKENAELAKAFYDITGIAPVKSQFGRWVKDLRDLAEAEITIERMKKTIDYMRMKDIPISGPGSILKTAQWLKARGSVPVPKTQGKDTRTAAEVIQQMLADDYNPYSFLEEQNKEHEVVDI